MRVADIITPFAGGSTMAQITTLGIDTAKQVFQLHGVDAQGNVVLHKRVMRKQLLEARRGSRTVDALPVTNERQVCEHQRGLRVFDNLDETLCQAMVRPALQARLASGHLLDWHQLELQGQFHRKSIGHFVSVV
jgi:hypothetical protein